MAQLIEHVNAHYHVQEVEFGTVYRWCPESVVVECDCGEKLFLTASGKACAECGTNHETIVEEVLNGNPEANVEHPWRSVSPYYTPIRGA